MIIDIFDGKLAIALHVSKFSNFFWWLEVDGFRYNELFDISYVQCNYSNCIQIILLPFRFVIAWRKSTP